MAKFILMDEYHITVQVPADLPPAGFVAVRAALDDHRFARRLRHAVRTAFHRQQALTPTRVRVSK